MRQEIIDRLRVITEEERQILEEGSDVRRELYTTGKAFVVNSQKLLEKGRLIDIRPHTRFVHFPRHRHDYVEMVYMCDGSTTHIVGDDDRIVLEKGDLLLLSQHAWHEILPAAEGDIAVNFIILSPFFDRALAMVEKENILRDFLISAISGETASAGYLHIRAGDIVPIQNLLENMIWSLLTGGRADSNTIQQTTMGLLFVHIAQYLDRIDRDDPGQREEVCLYSVLNYIDSHYRTGTLAEAAAETGLPDYTVSRLLKKRTGMNFRELLQKRKLEQAAYLLSNTPMSIDRILESIGYDNSSYFYRRFRERYGLSPAAFREQNMR